MGHFSELMVLPIVAGIAGLALRAAPYAIRGARAVVNPTNLRNYFFHINCTREVAYHIEPWRFHTGPVFLHHLEGFLLGFFKQI